MLLLFRLKKVLIVLFAIEFITIKVLFFFVYLRPSDFVSLLIFLAVAASEASIGLRLMISLLRQMGNDKLLARKMNKFLFSLRKNVCLPNKRSMLEGKLCLPSSGDCSMLISTLNRAFWPVFLLYHDPIILFSFYYPESWRFLSLLFKNFFIKRHF